MAIDYIYGSLDDMVTPVEYYGSETKTTETNVDNKKRVISVDVKKVPKTLTIVKDGSEVVFDGSENRTIEISSGESYTSGEGIVIEDNAISIDDEVVAKKDDFKTINGESVIGEGNIAVRTYQVFNDSWNLSGTTLAFCQSIEEDDTAPEGTAYLGTLSCSDLPNGMVQAEATVEIISSGANGKCIDITLTSLEVSPYRWTYSYGRVNGSVVTVGWTGSPVTLNNYYVELKGNTTNLITKIRKIYKAKGRIDASFSYIKDGQNTYSGGLAGGRYTNSHDAVLLSGIGTNIDYNTNDEKFCVITIDFGNNRAEYKLYDPNGTNICGRIDSQMFYFRFMYQNDVEISL